MKLLNIINLFKKKPLVVNYVEMCITTKCTLKCKECWHLINHYTHREHFDLKNLISDVDAFCSAVDEVNNFCLLGGEPLLCESNLPDLIKHIRAKSNVHNVAIITNGTVIPSEKVLTVLEDPKVYVEVSDYGQYSKKISELCRIFEDRNIKFNLRNCNDDGWISPGPILKHNRTQSELENVFYHCRVPLCHLILHGRYYLCPRIAHFDNLGLVPARVDEYVDLSSPQKLKFRMRTLMAKKSFAGCDFCNGFFYEDPYKSRNIIVPAAEQL